MSSSSCGPHENPERLVVVIPTRLEPGLCWKRRRRKVLIVRSSNNNNNKVVDGFADISNKQ